MSSSKTMAAIYSRSLIRLLLVLAVVVSAVGVAAPASAVVPNLSVSLTNPTPNPVPVGGTASITAQYSLSADAGPFTVGIQLQDPAFGTLSLDAANTTSELINCVEAATLITCEWDGEVVESPQTLTVLIDVAPTVTPNTGASIAAMAGSATEPFEPYQTNGIFASPPLGNTTISGRVITEGGTPVDAACVYLLWSPQFVSQTVADSTGSWAFTDLPDDYTFVIGVVPPFDLGFGACLNNGPPPVPAPGELQPVFYDDIWVDLANPDLTGGQMDPYVFAVNAGATVISDSVSGLEICLSTAPGSQVPRPPCLAAATTTTTTAGSTSSTAEILPVTGSSPVPLLAAGAVLTLLGLYVVMAARSNHDG